ncbi:Pbp2 protein [Saccharomycopsis crataegensis]|uniref:Pbp2 protein n=1 Tax=Saccharomycopsis crataegensis TaxID=43959 RepID=A0AAV5QMH5_9ASCO|nr:Pbp2 protein [Saccharomycopsis crataegensis]
MLKRKIEEEQTEDTTQTKRVAMDSEMLEQEDAEKDKHQTAPLLTSTTTTTTGTITTTDDNTTQQQPAEDIPKRSTPISSHKVQTGDDPTYVHFRMLCPVKEAGLIVGKGGEKISYIKERSGARVNVSENLKGVYERVVHVRGPAEKVAKAFGLITRVVIDEPETPSSPDSKQYILKLLVPHPVIGFVIGKGGTKFREIEEKSAAKLKASETTMNFSTDRCLSITGVPDAIHIATYYVGQTIYENKKYMHKTKVVYYNPGNSNYGMPPQGAMSPQGTATPAFPGAPQFNPPNFQFQGFGAPAGFGPQMMGLMPMNMGGYMNGQLRGGPGGAATNGGGPGNAGGVQQDAGQRQMKPYHGMNGGQYPSRLLSMPPSSRNHISLAPGAAPQGTLQPPQNFMPMAGMQQPQTSQDIYIPNEFVGSVIGKGGKNIREIRDNSGAQIKVQDPDSSSPSERKIVITGASSNNQMAIYLINNRIEMDRQKNQHNYNNNYNHNHNQPSTASTNTAEASSEPQESA